MIITQGHFLYETPEEERAEYTLTVFRKKYRFWLPQPLTKFKYLGVNLTGEICLCTTRPQLDQMFDVAKLAIGIGRATSIANRLKILEVPTLKRI